MSPSKGRILYLDGKYFFLAEHPGLVTLVLQVDGFETEKTVAFNVLSEDDLVPVYFTVKTESGNLFPWQMIRFGMPAVNDHVEGRKNDHDGNDRHSLCHALISGMQQAKVSFRFRDDSSASGRLYLYMVEKNDEFFYGWGGKTDPQAFARAWVARLNGKSHISGFDTIPVAAGDTITLYHVSDLTSPWMLNRLLTDRDSAAAGTRVIITLEQKQCAFSNGIVTESSFVPVPDHQIMAVEPVYTGVDGKAEFIFGQQLPVVVSAGNDAVIIFPLISTATTRYDREKITISPNPATDRILISGLHQGISVLELMDANGKIIQVIYPEPDDEQSIKLSDLTPGLYILRVISSNSVNTYKVVKR
jgi:hypothetical protein